MKFRHFTLLGLLLFGTSTFYAQEVYLENYSGIKEIKTYLIKVDEKITENTKIKLAESFDEEGRISQSVDHRVVKKYTYAPNGEVTIETNKKETGEFRSKERYLPQITDTSINTKILEQKYWAIADDLGNYGGVDYASEFERFPKSIKCDECTHAGEYTYELDEKGRPATRVEYRVKKLRHGTYLRRGVIRTYEWTSDTQYIERWYEMNGQRKMPLYYIRVMDDKGATLFKKLKDFRPIDEFDNDSLKEVQPVKYKYNDKGDWIERIEIGGKVKTVREITYY